MPKKVTYCEPTYHLHLSPLKSSQSAYLESVTSKNPTYKSLDQLVDQAIHERYRGDFEKFSSDKKKQIRKQVAHSFMQRPDQKSSMKIQMPLAEDQGLAEKVIKRLQAVVDKHPLKKKVDLTPFAKLLFSPYEESVFGELLAAQFFFTFRSNPSLQNEFFAEMSKMKKELTDLTESTMAYIRPPQSTDGQSYLNHKGVAVPLSQTIPSSFDRDHEDVQNGRLNLDREGYVIYSTGRIETERKANQVIDELIRRTLSSGQLTEENLIRQDDGYLYPIVIDNLINSSPAIKKERGYLLEQDEMLRRLDGQVKHGRLKNGKTIKLILKPIHFSSHSNYNLFFGQSNSWSSTGSKLSEEISNRGLDLLEKIYEKRSLDLPVQNSIQFCLKHLRASSSLRDRFMFRAFICELLDIPYHIHCKSSKDRTAILAAIKKALHQWLGLEHWKTDGRLTLRDPREFFNDPVFREYSEAAFFENLPMTDQGVGIAGEFGGKLHAQDRGFDYRFSLIENPLPAFVLSDRYLHHASLVKRILYALTMSLVGVVGAILYIAFSPLIAMILYLKHKDQAWEVYKYGLICLLLLPIRSGFRQKWLNKSSPTLKERGFFRTHLPKETAPSLKSLFNNFENLPDPEYKKLLRLVKTGLPKVSKECQEVLQDIANHWLILQRCLEEKASMPSRLKAILDAANTSPLLLFQHLKNFSQQVVLDAIKKAHTPWPTETIVDDLIRHPPIEGPIKLTKAFKDDYERAHYIVQGKHRRFDFPNGNEETRSQDFARALQELSVFKGSHGIPFPVQEALTQKSTLYFVSAPIRSAMNFKDGLAANSNERTLLLEEGDASFFWLTIKEKTAISSTQLRQNAISFEYSYTFKISKISADEWTTEFVALSPLEPKVIEGGFPTLLESSKPIDLLAEITENAFETLKLNLFSSLEAAAVWTDKSYFPLSALKKQIVQQLSRLSTTFAPEFFKTENVKDYLKSVAANLQKPITQEGEALIYETTVSYLKLLNEEQLIKILVEGLLKPESYSKLLKTVLSPKKYLEACLKLKLNPSTETFPTLQGQYPQNRFSKEMKYYHFFAHFIQLLQTEKWKQFLQGVNSADESELKKQCLRLYDILTKPTQFNNARVQYRTFVKTLRSAIDLSKQKDQDLHCIQWVHALAYERFAGIQLYDYCLGLVEAVSGPFADDLTIDNFWEELQARNERIKKLPKSQTISWIDRNAQETSGLANIGFDSSLRSNLPYIYGKIEIREREITVLRHGTPISQTLIPDITSDYLAFTEEAKNQNHNILHIVLENADWKLFADESGRAQARLKLASDSYFPIALRMDGPFVNPTNYIPWQIDPLKEFFLNQLLGPFEQTCFSIPDQIKEKFETAEKLKDHLRSLMDQIHESYFKEQEKLDTKQEFQAFIFLTYAAMTLSFCELLEVDILEALCKDDIDRGNAFKAILVLHHLYMTGQLNRQKLQELMVNILAAPLIVKKQSILPHRAEFIKHTLEVIKRVYRLNPLPKEEFDEKSTEFDEILESISFDNIPLNA